MATPASSARESDYQQKIRFVSDLGLSLHDCGASSHRIEGHLSNMCGLLGIHGTFLYTPTSLTFCYWLDNAADQHIQIERLQPGGGNLGRLELIDSLVESFEADELDFATMREKFDELVAAPDNYNRWLHAVAWVALSTSFAALLSSNAADAIVSGLVSLPIFLLDQAAKKSARIANTLEILASLISGIIVAGIATAGVEINVPFVVLSTVIAFVPGLDLTVALNEIAQRDLVSGTAKLMNAVMNLFKLYFGALLGVGFAALLWGGVGEHHLFDAYHLPEWRTLPFIFILSLGLTVVFNIRFKQIPWCLMASFIGFYASQMGVAYFGEAAGMFLGALAVGIYANLFAIISNKPASIVLTQGLTLLVPGSKTYIVLNTWITGEKMLTKEVHGTQAFLIFISLVVGLLFANAVLPTRKSL